MAEYGPWYGDTMTISVTEATGSTSIPVGSTQSLELTIEAEETEYFSADSALRDAVRHSQRVPVVSFTIGSWDVDVHRQWLSGGTDDATATSISDTNVPEKFDIQGSISPTDSSSQAWQITVSGVTISNMPFFSAELSEFVGLEVEGRGDDITIDQPPTPV